MMKRGGIVCAVVVLVALTGCSAAPDDGGAPAPVASVTASASASAKAERAVVEPSPTADPEAAYVAAVEAWLGDKRDAIAKEIPANMTEEYWVKRGNVYCKQIEKSGEVEFPRLPDATEMYLEYQLAAQAQQELCPAG